MKVFHGDNPKALTKQKELAVYHALQGAGIQFDYQHHVPFRSCGLESETRCAYVDFVIYKPWGAILLEVDEAQHSAYPASCDVRRDFDIAAAALGSAPKVSIVRYNPDCYRVAGTTRRTSAKARLEALTELLQKAEEPEGTFERRFLYYDRDAEDAVLPTIAKEWEPAAREVSRNAAA